ncbi:MAG: hypothetical protein KIS77_02145 [Saprospiraceae bacterium]|nr:hypothetical protein [Saprospiraceae bacterium]
MPIDYSYGRGRAANGGGGGNGHNGGGNGGVGGNGGLEYWYAPGAPTLGTDGVGGLKVFESDVQRVIMGGGGGAGHTNDNVGSSGGNGGGIIILRAKEIVTSGGAAVLLANGADVLKFGNNNNDGQGGGGAGGTILIEAEAVNGMLYCDLKGGRGGDCLFYVMVQIIGAGGGGSGGKLMLSQSFPSVSANLVGGANGMANQNQTNGAQPGQQGVLLAGASIMEGTVPAGVQMISQSLTLCPNSSITLNGKTFDQPGVFMDTLAGLVGCDTIITYHVQFAPYDVVFDIEDVFCVDGKQRLRYSLCNRGASDWPDEIEVAFFDADPTKGAANQLGVLSFPTAGADSCISGVLPDFPLAAQLPSGSALYSVANFNGSLSAPFSFDDFPATMLDECDYTNNLDSFVIQLPGSEVSIRDENCKHPGEIIITANGGTPPFEYKLNDGPWGSANIFGGLGAGDYSLSVRDASGCEGTGTYTIQPYVPLAIRLDSIGHIDCTQHEGFIAVSATGGGGSLPFSIAYRNPTTNRIL